MNLDFHTHGKLAKKLPFSPAYTDWLFGEAQAAGLDALCLTEHFNTLQFNKLYGYLLQTAVRDGDTLVLENGLRIFPGMETDIAEGGHVLSIGPAEAILELNARLERYKTPGSYLPFARLAELFREYPVLIGAGHPFRQGGHIPELPEELLAQFDFLDLNGKDIAENADRTKQLVEGLGARLGKPVAAGSDTHQAVQYGCVRTVFPQAFSTIEALRSQLAEKNYRIEVSEQAAFQVRTAGLLKRALKEIHALGGDYVQLLTGVESSNPSCCA